MAKKVVVEGVEKKPRINSKAKGGTLERLVVNDLKPIFPFAKTSRLSSRLLDNCDVDINNIPFLIQCKCGYNNIRFKFEEMYRETKRLIAMNFPPDDPKQNYPYILIHQRTGTKGKKEPEMFQVTMSYETFLKLVKGDK